MARHLSPTRARRQPPAVYPLPIDCSTVGFLPETTTRQHDTIPTSAAACPLAHLEDPGLLKAERLHQGQQIGQRRRVRHIEDHVQLRSLVLGNLHK
jgi:hypothetical protein